MLRPTNSLPSPPFRAARLLLLVLLAVGLAAACSGSDTPDVSTGATNPGTTPVPVGTTGGVAATCDNAALLAAVTAKYAAATIDDVVCASGNAALTIVGAEAIGGDGVGILVGTTGSWVLAGSGPIDADPNVLLPEKFSLSVYNAWRDKYDARKNPSPTVSRVPRSSTTSSGSGSPSTSEPRCVKQGDRYLCDSPSTITTTTTAPPPTKPPTTATTVPPTEPPTIAPTVPPPTQGPVVSPFCQANPFNPNCLANPGFPG